MKLDLQDISSEYGQHFDWDDAENHEVEMAMANVKPWEEKMMKLRKELSIMSGYYWTGTRCGKRGQVLALGGNRCQVLALLQFQMQVEY